MASPSSSPVAIITGCASGIGLATAQLFLQEGYRVFGVDVSDLDISKLGGKEANMGFKKANLTAEGMCEEVVKECTEKFGARIDVLANVAGVSDAFAAADTFTDAEFTRVMAINLTVPLHLMRAVLPVMKEQKSGAIVNVASKSALSGAAAGVAYTASKHGLLGATKHTAWRFKDAGIRCNAVLPGGVLTNIANSMQQQYFDMEAYTTLQPVHNLNTPQGKPLLVTPEHVANAIFFLASEKAKFISGAALPVDTAWSTI
ncbi:hypothetical protein BP5796_00436 [Coleophoma crateriformis]|uniref:Uncharacterized protein n=1 Tax=Coleophoma crateriformis TaxID=565419 RepID=A0A3D8T7X2_9HELO|nr:hypothetical protein BP5796_00436 [Coleophoma crateriformis]